MNSKQESEKLVARKVNNLLAQREVNAKVENEIRKSDESRLSKFLDYMNKSQHVIGLYETQKGNDNFTEIKLSESLTSSLAENNLIDYAAQISSEKFINVFEIYYSELKGCIWYDRMVNALFNGTYISYIDNPREMESDSRTRTHAIVFWFCHNLATLIKNESITIKSLSYDGMVPVFSIMEFLKANEPELILHNDGIKLGGIFENCEIQSSFFGKKLVITTKHIVRGVDGLKISQHYTSIPLKTQMLKSSELPFREIMEEEKAQLIDRGKKYVEYTNKASYLNYKGQGIRNMGWFGSRTFNCTGRVMVDLPTMTKSDPDYKNYFGITDRYGSDNLETADIEKYLFAVSPYVYGYSMKAKKWVELNIENISEIKFNDNAFDLLVLDGDVKNLIMSLVSADKTGFKDIIEHKGLGYIFLLGGGPGVGK